MGKEFDAIDERINNWIQKQSMFFVSTAPLSAAGLVNCSPKGQDTLRVLDPNTLAYLDLGGSGVETIAHLKENGRIVIMMCAFEGPPKIFRFYGGALRVLRTLRHKKYWPFYALEDADQRLREPTPEFERHLRHPHHTHHQDSAEPHCWNREWKWKRVDTWRHVGLVRRVGKSFWPC